MSAPARRSDAERNRQRILAAARTALADHESAVSMAEVARQAGVGMATLYRNFPGRRELLEALYAEDVDEIVAAAARADGSPGEALEAWLASFAAFHEAKHPVAAELLRHAEGTDPVFVSSRDRVVAAGRPLLAAAQQAGEARADLSLEQVLDLVLAVLAVPGDDDYVEPILRTALRGLRP